jgi:hypothetical protein
MDALYKAELCAAIRCAGYFLRYIAYFYRFYVLYAMYHPLLCCAEASCLGYPFKKQRLKNDAIVAKRAFIEHLSQITCFLE